MMNKRQTKKAKKAAKKAHNIAAAISTAGLSTVANAVFGKKSRKMGVRGEAKVEVKSLKKQAREAGSKTERKELRTKAKNVAIKWRNEKRAGRGNKKAQAKLDSGYTRGYNRGGGVAKPTEE